MTFVIYKCVIIDINIWNRQLLQIHSPLDRKILLILPHLHLRFFRFLINLTNIRTCKNFNISKEDTIRNLMKEFSLSEPEAVSYVKILVNQRRVSLIILIRGSLFDSFLFPCDYFRWLDSAEAQNIKNARSQGKQTG